MPSSLDQLVRDPFAAAAFVWAGSTLAVVKRMDGWFWVQLYTGNDQIFGNHVRSDLPGTVTLLSKAGVPADRGWVAWQS